MGCLVGAWTGSLSCANNFKGNIFFPALEFRTQRLHFRIDSEIYKEAHLLGGVGGAAASVILGSPGQFLVALEHFHQAGVIVVPDCQVQGLPTGHHYVLYTPLSRKVYLV